MVDHAHVAWRCTCPSRSHPCKHALALLIMWVKGQVPEAPAPTGVRSWADGHARREAAGGGGRPAPPTPGAAADDADDAEPLPDGPPDLERQRDERIARLLGGLVELDRWLDDRVRTGLADPALARYATWDDLAARLVDARAGALANRVRRLAGVVGARPDWHEVVLAELGILHLLAEAGQRVPELPGGLADAVGDVVRLAGPPGRRPRRRPRHRHLGRRRSQRHPRGPHRGPPHVAARAGVGALGDGALVRRLPPIARHHARRRRCVHGRPPPLPGAVVAGLVGARLEDGVTHPVAPAATDVAGACDEVGTALAAEPWLDRIPATVVATPAFAGGRWVLTDDGGALALAPDAPGVPTLLAASAGRPITVTVEWTIDGCIPLTVHLPDRALDVGPRADLSFVSAA